MICTPPPHVVSCVTLYGILYTSTPSQKLLYQEAAIKNKQKEIVDVGASNVSENAREEGECEQSSGRNQGRRQHPCDRLLRVRRLWHRPQVTRQSLQGSKERITAVSAIAPAIDSRRASQRAAEGILHRLSRDVRARDSTARAARGQRKTSASGLIVGMNERANCEE